jgi:hypothetical protein
MNISRSRDRRCLMGAQDRQRAKSRISRSIPTGGDPILQLGQRWCRVSERRPAGVVANGYYRNRSRAPITASTTTHTQPGRGRARCCAPRSVCAPASADKTGKDLAVRTAHAVRASGNANCSRRSRIAFRAGGARRACSATGPCGPGARARLQDPQVRRVRWVPRSIGNGMLPPAWACARPLQRRMAIRQGTPSTEPRPAALGRGFLSVIVNGILPGGDPLPARPAVGSGYRRRSAVGSLRALVLSAYRFRNLYGQRRHLRLRSARRDRPH